MHHEKKIKVKLNSIRRQCAPLKLNLIWYIGSYEKTQIGRIEFNVINIRKTCSKRRPFNGIFIDVFGKFSGILFTVKIIFRKVTNPRPPGFLKLLIGRGVELQYYWVTLKFEYGYTEYNILHFSWLVPWERSPTESYSYWLILGC